MDRIRRLEWPQRLSLARERGVAPCLCTGLVPDVGIPASISSADDNALGFCILGMRRRPSSGRKAHTSRGCRRTAISTCIQGLQAGCTASFALVQFRTAEAVYPTYLRGTSWLG